MKKILYQKVRQFVIKSFEKAGFKEQIPHFLRTVYWAKELRPDIDEAMLIAAVSHDIERAFGAKRLKTIKNLEFNELEYLRPHQERGAEIIAKFLKEQGVNKTLIERVKHLISRHEEGGDEDQNLLKDADAVSMFETSVSIFMGRVSRLGKDKVKNKFDWMFNRISSERAKEIAKPWYDEAIKRLRAIND